MLIVGAACLHILSPQLRPHIGKFFSLSYASSTSQQKIYTQGADDIYFITAWIIFFTALRAIVIDWGLQPLAKVLGVPKKSHLRFAEQGWLFLYYSMLWALGMVSSSMVVPKLGQN